MLHHRQRRETEDGDEDAAEECHGYQGGDEGWGQGGQGGGICGGAAEVSF